MANESELITGTITVPRGIWTDVLEYAARRAAEYGKGGDGRTVRDVPDGRGGGPSGSSTVNDLVSAANARARKVYGLLATNAGKPVSIDDISKAVGFDGHRTPGLLGSMGRSMWSRGFRNAVRNENGYWSWYASGPEFPGGEGDTPPDNVVWGWDPVNRTLTMPSAIAADFIAALR